ncbi:MAG: hemolysin III family protein [Deltaproteobacteria bacterium]|nr:hemolysin III family protein [Deltaproteobacteria bacterium]
MNDNRQRYTTGEEIANSVTHGAGILLSVTGLCILTALAAMRGNAWHVVACSIFGATLVLMYTASTLYHGIPLPRAKNVFRVLDHAAIFLLIAGTYTPFTLISLRGPWGWTLFGIIWGLALFGIIFQTSLLRRWTALSVGIYVAMGWAAVTAIKPLIEALPPSGLVFLVAGGLCYTLGVVFYVWRRLPYGHAIWHGFVLAGSVFHFFAVLVSVIPETV